MNVHFSPLEINQFTNLLNGNSYNLLPDPDDDKESFMAVLENEVMKLSQVYNPLTRQIVPYITFRNIDKPIIVNSNTYSYGLTANKSSILNRCAPNLVSTNTNYNFSLSLGNIVIIFVVFAIIVKVVL